jgi:hypothetical protein
LLIISSSSWHTLLQLLDLGLMQLHQLLDLGLMELHQLCRSWK